jgi:hypothetical protein
VLYDRPIRELLVDAVAAMQPVFRRQDVVVWFARHYPLVKASSVTAHITAATVNSHSRHHYPGIEQHLIFQRPDGRLEQYHRSKHGLWDPYGVLVPGSTTGPVPASEPATRKPVMDPAFAFEERARQVCSARWGRSLHSAPVEVAPGVAHQFDLVSQDRLIVGDAKYYKNIPTPAAKWSVISEYVWLLQHLGPVDRKFLVFGQDSLVPERWLARFRPLVQDVEFYFLDDDDDDLIQLA